VTVKHSDHKFTHNRNNKHGNAVQRYNRTQLQCEPMPNVMAAQPNIGGAVK